LFTQQQITGGFSQKEFSYEEKLIKSRGEWFSRSIRKQALYLSNFYINTYLTLSYSPEVSPDLAVIDIINSKLS
jgi:hypothetical protein